LIVVRLINLLVVRLINLLVVIRVFVADIVNRFFGSRGLRVDGIVPRNGTLWLFTFLARVCPRLAGLLVPRIFSV